MAMLYIKNMVCNRCITAVQQELEKVGLHPEKVTLGEISLKEPEPTNEQLHELDQRLLALGFERIDDRRARLIEGIKNKVIQMIHHQERLDLKSNWSAILKEEFHYDYNYLSTLFSSVEGTPLEQYIIRQKIERAKELLFYDELTLSQIADRLGYSNVAHLSAQFKKVTGFTPSALKKSRDGNESRKTLDKV